MAASGSHPLLRSSRFLSLRRLVAGLGLTLAAALAPLSPAAAQGTRTLTFTDLMQIRQIEQPSISPDGRWVAFTAEPDRGDPEVIVRSTDGEVRYAVPLARHPVIARTGRWVAMRLNPSLEAQDRAERRPKNGMVLLATADGATETFEDVASFRLSADGRWLAVHTDPARDEGPGGGRASGAQRGETAAAPREAGTPLLLRHLESGATDTFPGVRDYAFAHDGALALWVVPDGETGGAPGEGLHVRTPDGALHAVDTRERGHYTHLTWSDDRRLAFVAATEDNDGEPGPADVMLWDGGAVRTLVRAGDAPEGWTLPAKNDLEWSEDGRRLFFGWRPLRPDELEPDPDPDAEQPDLDPYDLDAILKDRGVDVWHWRDARIIPQQKVLWPREKDRTYRAAYDFAAGRAVALADPELPDVRPAEGGDVALGLTDVPYRREATWEGTRRDVYVVRLADGTRTKVAGPLRSAAALSPEGRYVAFYDGGDYHLYDVEAGTSRNVTAGLAVPFANEDHDYPQPAPGYGVAGWLADDAAVLIYDKYDIWVVPTDGGAPWMLTDGAGRAQRRIFRIVRTDPDGPGAIGPDAELLLSSYHDLRKNFGFYRARAHRRGVTRLLEEERAFRFVAKADDADVVLFTREDYDEFPDLWVARDDFGEARRLTDVNPQITEFAWGTSELVEWRSDDGVPLQGVVIKPGNYQEGRRYPVLVYFYRFMSDRLHRFNDPSVNHRPSFPVYASDGYVVFLPDVRFEVGRPGLSSMKSVVPGVQHLIDIGLADPDAIALHGHSWSGYQTAFVVTQTHIFTTAIAGAPVGNMTSAYSGIRLGSGLARQFQYENGQSRLRGSLWEARADYIDNSPVFFADRVRTPMLILHGDADDAVPWEQSIELFLALRRNDKEAVLLQYRDEPHHPQRYPNKLDWAMKMKEWLDHYLKGAPAPAWITEGQPYRGR